jgi:hypothetical protein
VGGAKEDGEKDEDMNELSDVPEEDEEDVDDEEDEAGEGTSEEHTDEEDDIPTILTRGRACSSVAEAYEGEDDEDDDDEEEEEEEEEDKNLTPWQERRPEEPNKIKKNQLRHFFSTHSAVALFDVEKPSDTDLDELLLELSTEELQEMLQETFGAQVDLAFEPPDEPPDASEAPTESAATSPLLPSHKSTAPLPPPPPTPPHSGSPSHIPPPPPPRRTTPLPPPPKTAPPPPPEPPSGQRPRAQSLPTSGVETPVMDVDRERSKSITSATKMADQAARAAAAGSAVADAAANIAVGLQHWGPPPPTEDYHSDGPSFVDSDGADPLATAALMADAAADFAAAAAVVAVVAAAESIQLSAEAMSVVMDAIALAKQEEAELAEAVERGRIEAEEEQARKQAAEEQARRNAEKEQARREVEEEQARRQIVEEQARREAEVEQARRRVAEEKARIEEEEEQAKRQAAEEQARREAEAEQARIEAEENAKRKAEEARRRREVEEEMMRRAVIETCAAAAAASSIAIAAATSASSAAVVADGWSAGAERSALIGFGGLRTSPKGVRGESETSNARAAAKAVKAARAKAKTVEPRKQQQRGGNQPSMSRVQEHGRKADGKDGGDLGNQGINSSQLAQLAPEQESARKSTAQRLFGRESGSESEASPQEQMRRKESAWEPETEAEDDDTEVTRASELASANDPGIKRINPSNGYGAIPDSPPVSPATQHGQGEQSGHVGEDVLMHSRLERLADWLAASVDDDDVDGSTDARTVDGLSVEAMMGPKQSWAASSVTQIVQALLIAHEKTHQELRRTRRELQALRHEVAGGAVNEDGAAGHRLREAIKKLREEAKVEKLKVRTFEWFKLDDSLVWSRFCLSFINMHTLSVCLSFLPCRVARCRKNWRLCVSGRCGSRMR